MDKVCGGDWWRDAWLDKLADKVAAEHAVVKGYAKRLARAARAGYWVIDVSPRAGLKPLYSLILATRHRDGLGVFGEASSLGLEKWRRYLAEQRAEGTLFGDGSWEQDFKAQEAILKAEWVDSIAERLKTELAKGEPFRVVDRYVEVFGDLLGVARRTHLLAALKKAYSLGWITTNPRGVKKLLELRLTPA